MESNIDPKIWKKQDTVLLKLPYSDFDSRASTHFRELIDNLLEAYTFKYLVLDFAEVVLIDGPGLAAILHGYYECNANGIKLLLSSLKPVISQTLQRRGIITLVEVFPSLHEALDAAMKYSIIDETRQAKTQDFKEIFGDLNEETLNL